MSDPSGPRSDAHQPLTVLVARTAGLQPWRRIVHGVTGLTIAGILGFLQPDRFLAAGALGILGGGLLAFDFIRLHRPGVNRFFFVLFQPLASPREAATVASSTWFMVGCGLTVALFPAEAAIPAILVLALADPLASYVGRRWGRRPLGSGTVEGSLVFLAAALGVLIPLTSMPTGVLAALGATWVERTRWRVDDNLAVPLATGALLMAFTLLLS